jgi:hypothetical protein
MNSEMQRATPDPEELELDTEISSIQAESEHHHHTQTQSPKLTTQSPQSTKPQAHPHIKSPNNGPSPKAPPQPNTNPHSK